MSIPTVKVTFTLNGQDGHPVSGVRILAKLSTLEKFNGLVVPQIYEGETDETGIAYLDVFPNELGSEGSEYKITIVDAQNGFSERLVAVIPNYDCNIWEITDLEPYNKKYAGAEFTEEVLSAKDVAVESATVAVSSSESASSSATTATEQANIATTKSTEASEAATIATEKASISIEKANEASASATSAEGSASNASDSATTATDKATIATTKADEASTSATTATDKATIATTKADEASSSASSASSSANSASDSASEAETYKDKSREWATTAEDVEVETGYYSAFHWAQKAAQSASVIDPSLYWLKTDEINASKLNNKLESELNVADSTKLGGILANQYKRILSNTVEVTVGTGGDFATINAAIEELSRAYTPVHLAGGNVSAIIRLKAGFVMEEQVVVQNADLSWITIVGDDAETVIDRESLSVSSLLGYPTAFTGLYSSMPVIGQLFTMNTSGEDANKNGIAARGSKVRISPQCGVKNAGSYGLLLSKGCTTLADYAVFSGCKFGAYILNSFASLAYSDISNSALYGVYAHSTSNVDASSSDTTGSNTGLYSLYNSNIYARNAVANLCSSYGAYAYSATINFEDGEALSSNSYAVYSRGGGRIIASRSNCTTVGSSYEYTVLEGSQIIMKDYIGSGRTNVALNTITSNGIIFN